MILGALLLLSSTLVLLRCDALQVPFAPVSLPRAPSRLSPLYASDDASPFEFWKNSEKDEPRLAPNPQWVSTGISAIYLSHFASLYTQLPGLFGQTGLLPITDRVADLDGLWALGNLPNAELGMEIFSALGIAISALQLIFSQLRCGPAGIVTYGLQWLFWHDLVVGGGRFMQYQMDHLLLDVAPLTVLSASGIAPLAATFGYRWLLSRLYLGAGAVKLLSCDKSWRDLSAIHWHFQSQPLPNPLGAAAYVHLPESFCQALTLAVLVVEMAAPFLFIAPSSVIRRIMFAVNILLMVGIATFGNFGPLQALLIVVGFALLDDPPSAQGSDSDNVTETDKSLGTSDSTLIPGGDLPSVAVSTISVALAAAASYWTVTNVGARCIETLAVEPLVYDLTALGAVVAFLPLFSSNRVSSFGTVAVSLVIFAGSAATMAQGLGVFLPFSDVLEIFNFGASPYGLFATMTGVNGRPVAAIEAAQSMDGPWLHVPLWYQVNDPTAPLPLCFPHFPRLDWTLWFIPLGESGVWIARFFNGIVADDPAVMRLVNEPEFRQSFPSEPPAIVRVVPRTYSVDPAGKGWLVTDDSRYSESPVLAVFNRGDLPREDDAKSGPSAWPSLPLLRPLADSGRPEYFVWGCLGSTEAARRVAKVGRRNGTMDTGPKEDGRKS